MRFDLSTVLIIYLLREGDALIVSQRGIRFRVPPPVPNHDLPFLAQNLTLFDERSLNRHFRVAEKVIWIDFGVFDLFKVGVQFHYLTDMGIGDKNPLVSEIPFHLIEEVNGVDQLYLTLPCIRFSVRQDPDIGGDTGVEEQLIGQRNNTLQPVVFDDPTSNFTLTAAGITL